MAPKPPIIPSLDEQIGCVRQLLESQSFDELGISDQVRWLGLLLKKEKNCPTELQSQWTRLNALLVHASRCQNESFVEDYTLDLSVNTSENLCMYPKCERGKVLYRHVRVCKRSVCLLCQSMLQLVKFHAGACTQSNCRVPRCGECKEYKLRKERRLRRNEWNDRRLKRLRRIERRLRQLYLPESRPAAAARAKVTAMSNASAHDHDLQLVQLSAQDGQGDKSNHNNVNKKNEERERKEDLMQEEK